MKRRVVVVGGAGYLGAVVCAELLKRDYGVTVVDRCLYGRDGVVGGTEHVDVDMRDVTAAALRGADALVNLGGLSNDPTSELNPEVTYGLNAFASEHLAKVCVEAGVRRYVLASSASVYDRALSGDDAPSAEGAPTAPQAVYAASKLEAERLVMPFVAHGLCVVVLRKGTLYGLSPRMRYDLVVNTFVKTAVSDGALRLHCGGEMWRPILDVRDAARAYVSALEAPDESVRGRVFNVASANVRVSELALRVRHVLQNEGVDADVVPDYGYRAVRSYRVDTSLCARVLGLAPSTTLEQSVRDVLAHACHADLSDCKYDNLKALSASGGVRLLESGAR